VYLLWFLAPLACASPPTNPMRVNSFVLSYVVQISLRFLASLPVLRGTNKQVEPLPRARTALSGGAEKRQRFARIFEGADKSEARSPAGRGHFVKRSSARKTGGE